MLMNKRSQFTKIFSQAILDIKDTGKLDIFHEEKYRQRESCNVTDQKEKSLGYKKLALLFAIFTSGTFMSLFVVLIEFVAKLYEIQKRQKCTTTIHEENSLEDDIKEIMDNLSKDEHKNTFRRILQNLHQIGCPKPDFQIPEPSLN